MGDSGRMTDLGISGMLGAGGTMKPLVKLLTDFITWRWAPAVGLLAASMIYVIVVVGLVPSEIGVPVANAKFEPSPQPASGTLFGGTAANVETNENTYGAAPGETRPVSTPPRPVMRAPVADFGKRGFSPRLDRPEPPPPAATPTPAAPPTTVAPAVTRGTFGGLFSRIQGALRPGSPAAQSLAEAAQARAAQQASAAAAPSAAPSAAVPTPATPNAAAPNAPAEGAPQQPQPPQPPDAQQPAPADSAAPAPSAEAPAQ